MIASSRNNILFEVGIAAVCVEYEIRGARRPHENDVALLLT